MLLIRFFSLGIMNFSSIFPFNLLRNMNHTAQVTFKYIFFFTYVYQNNIFRLDFTIGKQIWTFVGTFGATMKV